MVLMNKHGFVSSVSYAHDEARCFESCKGESVTVQGDSYTIKELFDRYAKGLVVNRERPEFFEDTDDFDAIDFHALKHADPFDKAELMQDVIEKAQRAKKALDDYKKKSQVDKQDKYSPDTGDFDEDASKSSKTKNQSQSGKRGGEASEKERSDAERANSPSADT